MCQSTYLTTKENKKLIYLKNNKTGKKQNKKKLRGN